MALMAAKKTTAAPAVVPAPSPVYAVVDSEEEEEGADRNAPITHRITQMKPSWGAEPVVSTTSALFGVGAGALCDSDSDSDYEAPAPRPTSQKCAPPPAVPAQALAPAAASKPPAAASTTVRTTVASRPSGSPLSRFRKAAASTVAANAFKSKGSSVDKPATTITTGVSSSPSPVRKSALSSLFSSNDRIEEDDDVHQHQGSPRTRFEPLQVDTNNLTPVRGLGGATPTARVHAQTQALLVPKPSPKPAFAAGHSTRGSSPIRTPGFGGVSADTDEDVVALPAQLHSVAPVAPFQLALSSTKRPARVPTETLSAYDLAKARHEAEHGSLGSTSGLTPHSTLGSVPGSASLKSKGSLMGSLFADNEKIEEEDVAVAAPSPAVPTATTTVPSSGESGESAIPEESAVDKFTLLRIVEQALIDGPPPARESVTGPRRIPSVSVSAQTDEDRTYTSGSRVFVEIDKARTSVYHKILHDKYCAEQLRLVLLQEIRAANERYYKLEAESDARVAAYETSIRSYYEQKAARLEERYGTCILKATRERDAALQQQARVRTFADDLSNTYVRRMQEVEEVAKQLKAQHEYLTAQKTAMARQRLNLRLTLGQLHDFNCTGAGASGMTPQNTAGGLCDPNKPYLRNSSGRSPTKQPEQWRSDVIRSMGSLGLQDLAGTGAGGRAKTKVAGGTMGTAGSNFYANTVYKQSKLPSSPTQQKSSRTK